MGQRIGIDFGTATTCVGFVDEATQLPKVLHLDGGAEFVDSLVWFDGRDDRTALLAGSPLRAPKSICQEANGDFVQYWQERRFAQADSLKWHEWNKQEREAWMLLSYFKPELADIRHATPRTIEHSLPGHYDQMSQYEETASYTSTVWVADPLPETIDFIVGTAALLRHASRIAVERTGQRLDVLMMGVPALDVEKNSDEALRGEQHRRQAVELARLKEDFGTSAFRLEFCSETMAAASGLTIETESREPLVLVIDVGAGTTDLAVVEYFRTPGGRWLPREEVLRESLRLAGRDINVAIAHDLMQDHKLLGAFQAMDRRSWQLLLDQEIERIKRTITKKSTKHRIPFFELAAHPDGGVLDRAKRDALRKAEYLWLELGDVPCSTFLGPWSKELGAFLERTAKDLPEKRRKLASVELVGGGCRFVPLVRAVEQVLADSPFKGTSIHFLDGPANDTQTVVARGLANEAVRA